jgi:hypothetical protein
LVAASLLIIIIFVATALSRDTDIGLALLLHRQGGWGLPSMTLCGPGTLAHQAEERRDILDVMGGELLQHLLIPHTLVKCNHNISIGDTGNGIASLGEPLNEGA